MPLYQWNDSTIAQLESITNAPGKVEAIIRPQAGADPKSLSALRQKLIEKGITNYVGCDKNVDTLIVPDIDNAGKLVNLLSEGGWTKGDAQVTNTAEDKEIAADTSKEKLRKNSLLLSAAFYDIGNVACLVSGYMRGKHNRDGKWTAADKSEFMTGVMFSIGDILMTIYGKGKTNDPLAAFSDELQQHMAHFGIDVPKGNGVTPDQVAKSGFFPAASDYIARHITSIKCMSEAAGGAFMIKSALKKDNFNGGKLAAGLMIATGWLSTFILDKPHAPPYEFKLRPEEEPHTTGSKLLHWAGENPRGRIGAPLGMLNNLSNLLGANNERKKFNKELLEAREGLAVGHVKIGGEMVTDRAGLQANVDYHHNKRLDYSWNVVSACTFLIAHTLFGLSGTKKSERDVIDHKAFSDEILAVSANMLLNIPDKARELAVEQAAEYVTSINGVTLRKEEAVKAIQDHIEHLRYSPFLMPSVSR